MNTEIYLDILRRARDVTRRKSPEKCRTNSWFLRHGIAAVHRSFWVKDFLAKYNVTKMEHPPYSPNLAPANFYLSPRLKSALKGRRFCDATDIKNATEELKRLSQNDFQENFQHVYGRQQEFIFAQDDSFDGIVV